VGIGSKYGGQPASITKKGKTSIMKRQKGKRSSLHINRREILKWMATAKRITEETKKVGGGKRVVGFSNV